MVPIPQLITMSCYTNHFSSELSSTFSKPNIHNPNNMDYQEHYRFRNSQE